MDREVLVKVTRDTTKKTVRINYVEKVNGQKKTTINVKGKDIEEAIVALCESMHLFSVEFSFTCPIIQPPDNSFYPFLCNNDLCRGWDSESDSCLLIQKPEKKKSLKQWLKKRSNIK